MFVGNKITVDEEVVDDVCLWLDVEVLLFAKSSANVGLRTFGTIRWAEGSLLNISQASRAAHLCVSLILLTDLCFRKLGQ